MSQCSGQAMLTTVLYAPHELRLAIVELQAVGLHPVGDSGDAVGDCRQEHVDV